MLIKTQIEKTRSPSKAGQNSINRPRTTSKITIKKKGFEEHGGRSGTCVEAFDNSRGVPKESVAERACHAWRHRIPPHFHHLMRHRITQFTPESNEIQLLVSNPTYLRRCMLVPPPHERWELRLLLNSTITSALNPQTKATNYNRKSIQLGAPPIMKHMSEGKENTEMREGLFKHWPANLRKND